jgi:hypothetical protein
MLRPLYFFTREDFVLMEFVRKSAGKIIIQSTCTAKNLMQNYWPDYQAQSVFFKNST